MQQFDFTPFPDADPPVDRRIPLGDDRTLSFEIYEDGAELDENQAWVSGSCRNVTGYALTFIVRTSDKTTTAALITKSTSGSGIMITGVFNATKASNTQRVEVAIQSADTWASSSSHLSPKTYRYALKRTDAGNETTLAYGDFELFETTARD